MDILEEDMNLVVEVEAGERSAEIFYTSPDRYWVRFMENERTAYEQFFNGNLLQTVEHVKFWVRWIGYEG